jgi:hypothetical protein
MSHEEAVESIEGVTNVGIKSKDARCTHNILRSHLQSWSKCDVVYGDGDGI